MNFDFLVDTPQEPLVPEVVHHGPNGKSMKKMSRRDVIQDFLDLYVEENGKEIMRNFVRSDPKFFGEILKKLIPNQMSLDAGELMQVKLVDRYGNSAEVTQVGLNPALSRDLDPANSADLPQVEIRDRFGAGQPTKQIATGSSPDFDFEL